MRHTMDVQCKCLVVTTNAVLCQCFSIDYSNVHAVPSAFGTGGGMQRPRARTAAPHDCDQGDRDTGRVRWQGLGAQSARCWCMMRLVTALNRSSSLLANTATAQAERRVSQAGDLFVLVVLKSLAQRPNQTETRKLRRLWFWLRVDCGILDDLVVSGGPSQLEC